VKTWRHPQTGST